jgi:TusA-related sulfurtransferase
MSTYKLNVSQEHCPMTFVRTKIQLAKLSEGDILEVLVSEGEPLDNIPGSAVDQGYKVLSVSETETKGLHLIVIQK